jgi:deoxyribodipyrimidine photo-lyase
MTIFWFRRDLRLADNAGLFHALVENDAVLPIFIFDEDIITELPTNDHRLTYIHEALSKMNAKLIEIDKSIAVFKGKPMAVWEKIIRENVITSVYINHDYEPYARKRDLAVFELFKKYNIALKSLKDQVIFEKSDIVKDDGKPYVVYTPYSRKWLEKFKQTNCHTYPSEEYLTKICTHNYPFLSLDDLGLQRSNILMPKIFYNDDFIANYEANRNFPSNNHGTSKLGVALRFGTFSIRHLVKHAITFQNITFLKELIWREFFMQILWHFPHTVQESFKPKYDQIKWVNNESDFTAWCNGQTGYPMVDAGMRELNATGHMHNRVRMVVASFLCKHLLIDWRWGEAYFAKKLFDFELSSNVGNWQWAAGSGVDAAPYFRIFNPTEQIKKFDKDLVYIKKWVPEVNELHYVQPIVEHKFARERCLSVFKAAVG